MDAFQKCDQTNPLFAVAEDYFSDFAQASDAAAKEQENYTKNKETIDRDVAHIPE